MYYMFCDKYLKQHYTKKDTIHKISANVTQEIWFES